MSWHLAYLLLTHGWRLWAEWHPYGNVPGGWLEWLAAR